jgi:hypothetical protein
MKPRLGKRLTRGVAGAVRRERVGRARRLLLQGPSMKPRLGKRLTRGVAGAVRRERVGRARRLPLTLTLTLTQAWRGRSCAA